MYKGPEAGDPSQQEAEGWDQVSGEKEQEEAG